MRALKQLESSYNPLASKYLTRLRNSKPLLDDFSNYVAKILAKYALTASKDTSGKKSMYTKLKKFKEAWNHPDPVQQKMWREAILKEFGDMIKHKIYRHYARSKMPKNKRCVKCKWVFKIKRDDKFRARLVACGYSQVPGIDFVEKNSLVINNMTVKILIILMLVKNLHEKLSTWKRHSYMASSKKRFSWKYLLG